VWSCKHNSGAILCCIVNTFHSRKFAFYVINFIKALNHFQPLLYTSYALPPKYYKGENFCWFRGFGGHIISKKISLRLEYICENVNLVTSLNLENIAPQSVELLELLPLKSPLKLWATTALHYKLFFLMASQKCSQIQSQSS